MITTLFKHEILRTWRWLALVTLAAALIVATFSGAAMLLPGPVDIVMAVLANIIAVGYMLALPLLISLDFYRSCYSKTGYFTASIPASGETIFTVKAAYAYLVSLIGVLISLALLIPASIATGATAGVSAAETLTQLRGFLDLLAGLPGWLLATLAVAALLYPLANIAPFFFAATVGSQNWINRAGFGGVVLTWFLYYTATQLLGLGALFIPPTLDLRAYPDLSLLWSPTALFSAGDDAAVLPLAVFVMMFLTAIVAMWWAKVSYSRKLELR